jgi:predicted nucleotidyltransferase
MIFIERTRVRRVAMSLIETKLGFRRADLSAFCRKHHIRRLSFFGSAVRDDFREDSDIDVLVEFEPGRTPGFGIIDVQDELSRLFGGRSVDIVNPKYLNPLLRDRILAEAQVSQFHNGVNAEQNGTRRAS